MSEEGRNSGKQYSKGKDKKGGDTMYHDEEFEIEHEYLTPLETMALLYIGKNTFYRLVNSGELKAFRIGKLWRVKRESIEEYIHTHSA